MNANDWLDIVTGKNRDWYASLARLGLDMASVPYGIVTELRNRAYSMGVVPVRGVSAPVISIGNLTVGGTGKTPTVAWMVHQLQELGMRPGILSRGYRSLNDEENDEKRLLDCLCPGVPHIQQPDRFAGAMKLLSETTANVIVLDDGFQHRRLHRDLDLVLIDSLQPWGLNYLLPRGMLRERAAGLSRADLILLTRSQLVSEGMIQKLRKQIARWTPAPVLRTRFEPTGLIDGAGNRFPLEVLQERVPYAFCGIGNPDGFRATLQPFVSLPPERFQAFPDHFHYNSFDLLRLQKQAQQQGADVLLTTRKDLVKVPVPGQGAMPCWGLEIELVFEDDPVELLRLLRVVLPTPEICTPQSAQL